MRVGLLIYGSLDTISGGYLYDRRLVATLRGAGDEVTVVSLPWRSYPKHISDNFSSSLLRRLTSLEVDVLVQDELNHPSLFHLNTRLRPQVGYPIVSLVHHLRSSEQHPAMVMPVYRAVEKRYLESVDAFIFNSRTTKGVVESLVGAGRPSVVGTPAGDRLGLRMSSEEIVQRSRQPGPLRCLFLGSVIPRKSLHTVLDALSHLPQDAWRLTVAGSLDAATEYSTRMKALVAARSWQDNVRFCGALGDDELRRILMEHHVVVLPSQYEGFGIAYLEGMSVGLPAIASTSGAAHEIIENGLSGFLIQPGDSENLAQILARLQRDRTQLAEMGLAAQAAYQTFPGWTESMLRVRQFLVETAGFA